MIRTRPRGAVFPALAAAFFASGALAQPLQIPDVTYPTLPAQAAGTAGFIPPGWAEEASLSGDLNGDGVADLAIVMRARDAANVLDNRGLGPRRFDSNPRMLAVAFGQPGQGGYTLVLQDHTLIPRPVSPTLEDPMTPSQDLAIARGALRVGLHLFSNAGSYGTQRMTFTFRWQDNRFALIGYDSTSVNRGSGAMEKISVNYNTRHAVRTTGSIETDVEETQRVTLPPNRLLGIGEVGNGINFEPVLKPG